MSPSNLGLGSDDTGRMGRTRIKLEASLRASWRGIPRAPYCIDTTTSKEYEMTHQNKNHTLSFRLAEDDYQKLVERCRKAELSQSSYLRYLIRIPLVTDSEHGEDVRCIVLDRKSMAKFSKELTRWGYHYNQAVRAMNTINYFITNGKADSQILNGKAETIEVELAAVNDNAQKLVYELANLQSRLVVKE